MRHLTGFAPLAAEYEGFVVDLWGVIHDGVTPYPGAIDVLRRLKAAGRPVVLLSNAPRRAHVAVDAMRGMGIARDLYTDIMTSGEATWRMLRDRTDPFFASLGERMFHLGPERDRNVFEGLPLTPVSRPADASFVLNTGPDDLTGGADAAPYLPLLEACASAGLPMICANPDLEVIRGGSRIICAGELTLRYEALGGVTTWVGKPDPAIYAPVLEMVGLPADRTLAVGDSLRTDIAGAAAAGLPSCWVLGGIHGALASDPRAAELAATGAWLAPVAAIPSFVW